MRARRRGLRGCRGLFRHVLEMAAEAKKYRLIRQDVDCQFPGDLARPGNVCNWPVQRRSANQGRNSFRPGSGAKAGRRTPLPRLAGAAAKTCFARDGYPVDGVTAVRTKVAMLSQGQWIEEHEMSSAGRRFAASIAPTPNPNSLTPLQTDLLFSEVESGSEAIYPILDAIVGFCYPARCCHCLRQFLNRVCRANRLP